MKSSTTSFQWCLEILCLLLLIGSCAYLFLSWGSIEQSIPMHYDVAGQIDRYGNKSELIALPILSWCLYALLTSVVFLPTKYLNFPIAITDTNKDQVFRYTKDLLVLIKLEIVAFFALLLYSSATVAPLPIYATLLFVISVLSTIVFSIVRIVKIPSQNKP